MLQENISYDTFTNKYVILFPYICNKENNDSIQLEIHEKITSAHPLCRADDGYGAESRHPRPVLGRPYRARI